MDLAAYDAYLAGKLSDYQMSDEDIARSTKELDSLPPAPQRKSGKW